jgi:hypothetical protein
MASQLPIFPYSFASAPSDLFLFLWFWRLLLSVPRAGRSLDGNGGEGSLSDDVFPLLRMHDPDPTIISFEYCYFHGPVKS